MLRARLVDRVRSSFSGGVVLVVMTTRRRIRRARALIPPRRGSPWPCRRACGRVFSPALRGGETSLSKPGRRGGGDALARELLTSGSISAVTVRTPVLLRGREDCTGVLPVAGVVGGGGCEAVQEICLPEQGLWMVARRSGVLLRLRRREPVDLEPSMLHGVWPQPMCHRGEMLAVRGGLPARLTKQKVCDGVALGLGEKDSTSGVRSGDDGVWRWSSAQSSGSRDVLVFFFLFEGLSAFIRVYLSLWRLLPGSRVLRCNLFDP